MKKILLVTTRYPYPAFGGDKNRFIGIAKSLADKNQVDIVCLSNKDHNEKNFNYFFNNIKIFKINIFIRILYSFFFFIKDETNADWFLLL
jgi:hypothetical protein